MQRNLTADEQRQVTQQTSVEGLGALIAALGQAGALYRFKWAVAPAAKSAANILNAEPVTAAVQAGRTANLLANPDVPRNVRLTLTLGGGTQFDAGTKVTVYGTDIKGNAISEDFVIGGLATASIVVGAKCFKTVTGYDLPARKQAGDAVSLGTGDKLGLDVVLFSASLLRGVRGAAVPLNTADAGTLVASSTDYATNGYTPATVPDGANLYRIFVVAERD